MRTTSVAVAQTQPQLLKSNKNTNVKRRANEKKGESAVIKFKNRIPSSSPAPGGNRDVAQSETSKSSRRALLATKGIMVLCEATVFPWLSEFYTRPKGGGVLDGFDIPNANRDIRVFSSEFFASLLPAEYSEYDVLRAKECLKTGESLMKEQKWDQAIVSLQQVEKLIPREYKMNQKTKLLIAECYKAMGAPQYFNAEYLEAKGSVWWWGRGLRWPGWYIIAYLGARHVFFESKEDKVGEASITEGILISVLAISYLMLLNQFGLPDL
jgi:hypothetical protein